MKKTLIALAVAASAVVSGSAMAWTANGTGGNVELGGTLTPVEKVTPWEVSVGAAVNGLDAQIQKGSSSISVIHANPIPLLGIRNNSASGFKGQPGIDPQINFHGAIDTAQFFQDGKGRVYLNATAHDDNGSKIGTMKTVLRVAAQANNGTDSNVMLYASSAASGFFGGLPRTADGVFNSADAYAYATSLFPGISDTWSNNGTRYTNRTGEFEFSNENHIYYAYYAAGIPNDENLIINLDTPAANDAIKWKVSLPITVSYQ
ncbi:TPA: hypothetical protein ACJFZM_004330 [Salmonella enterica subsp. enterica serovar Oranienburg]|nr:hypothetical protein [Salmonella enterica subsp. enterica serovar Montevideo]ECB7886225.1 hypothetical protein [Salmonella enterica subsp. enterica serovar Gaminara]EEG7058768.1 hypothetical protein [Salmonella enterica]EFU8185018.1 hypothetical protein [Salmonella enterica subsp. enterica serovar Gaminara]EJF6492955.1 hypothetical protein [Salmonella enterica]